LKLFEQASVLICFGPIAFVTGFRHFTINEGSCGNQIAQPHPYRVLNEGVMPQLYKPNAGGPPKVVQKALDMAFRFFDFSQIALRGLELLGLRDVARMQWAVWADLNRAGH
jgi:hypothetical protein